MQPFETKIGGPIYLYNAGCGGNLKAGLGLSNQINGHGKWAKYAKFMVRPTNKGPNIIRLSPWTDGKTHVKIPKHGGKANLLGGIGKWSLITVKKNGPIPGVVSLASTHLPNHHIGVLPNGEMKMSAKTGMGAHGQFCVVSGWMKPGARIHLHSIGGGGNVRFGKHTGQIEVAHNATGKWSKWIVTCPNPQTPQIVMLKHFVFRGKYLAIGQAGKVRLGMGGKWCHFYARPAGKHKINLRSVAHGGKRALGFASNLPKAAHKVGFGPHGQFRVTHW